MLHISVWTGKKKLKNLTLENMGADKTGKQAHKGSV